MLQTNADVNVPLSPLKKSLSFVDLVQQIQTILPIKNPPKKSRSFVDLTKSFPAEDANLNSNIAQRKFSNPRITSSVRRPSRTFRKYPEIVVDPPKENVTSSLPDITISDFNYPEILILNDNNVSEKNSSCPNLTDENVYQTFTSNLRVQNKDFQRSSSLDTSLDSLFESDHTSGKLSKAINFDRGSEYNLFSCTGKVSFQYGDINFEFQKHNKFEINTLECLNELYNLKKTVGSSSRTQSKNVLRKLYTKKGKHKINYKNPVDEHTKFNFDYVPKESRFSKDFATKAKRKYSYSVPKCKKNTDITPTDILKYKMKQSVSMQNLHFGSKFLANKQVFDNYHTIHSDSNFLQNSSNYNLDIRKSDSFDATAENKLLNRRKLFNFSQFYGSSNSISNANFRGFDSSESASGRSVEVQEKIVYKCCCGRAKCKAVVPIQQYLETYYEERVRNKTEKNKRGVRGCYLSCLRVLGLLHACPFVLISD